MLKKISLYACCISVSILISCKEISVPRPKGYFRIDLPEKSYLVHNSESSVLTNIPFTFEYPEYGDLLPNNENNDEPGWFNIDFPGYNARIYLTYKKIDDDFEELMEQTYTMNIKNHITKADAISEQVFINNESDVYGILYDLQGNTATAVQFYATDSVNNYLRGSLYFSTEPNADSLAPVIKFFREDIIHLMETLKW